MGDHLLSSQIVGFDLRSYYAGITAGLAEVVAMGCKRLALSPPYTAEQLEELRGASDLIARSHGLLLLVEPDLLVTPLFPADVARGRTVIVLAADQGALYDYLMLKSERASAVAHGRLAEVEGDLARRFGMLLGYDELAIERLLSRHSALRERGLGAGEA